ncbi:MAG: OadG family transporter subunit [Gemmiger sp.]
MNMIAMLSTDAAGITGFDLTVVATSFSLVFTVLAGLCLIITLEGKIFDLKRAKKQQPKQPPKQTPPAQAAAKPAATPAAAPAPRQENGIPGEVIAAIAAAVAYITGGTGKVKSVRRAAAKGSRRGAWGDAGVSENTRPFV